MPRIETVPVKSTNVKAVGYDAATKTLQVDFKSNTSYQFADVPADKAASLLAAESVGSYLAKEIKPHYTVTKLEDEE